MTLILDAAYPPADVNQWIATLRMAGASGCLAYIYDLQIPGNRWTPDYCHAIQAAGFGLLPVYVWGPTYPVIGHVRDATAAYGIASGPVMGDIEAGSMPSEAYFSGWCSDLRSNGYTPVAYGTASTLDRYRRYADKGFLASYIQRQLQPIPDLAGLSYDGWQYANSFQVNGVEVDASVTSIPLIGGIQDLPLSPSDQQVFDQLCAANPLVAQSSARTGEIQQELHDVKAEMDQVQVRTTEMQQEQHAIKAELDALSARPSGPDVTALSAKIDALAGLISKIEAALRQA